MSVDSPAEARGGSGGGYVPWPPPLSPRARRTVWLVVAGWVAVLLVAGTLYALHGAPTAREQTTISQAVPTLDRAVADLVAAAGPAAVGAIGGYLETGTCSLTPVRSGARYAREVTLYTAAGTGSDLVRRLATNLPKRYRPRVVPAESGATLTADAGDYVAVHGATAGDGEVRVSADTGCRAPGRPLPAAPATTAADRARLGSVFAALDRAPGDVHTSAAPCAGGTGTLRTVTGSAAGRVPLDQLAARLRATGWTFNEVLSGDGRLVLRAGRTGVAVVSTPSLVVVTMTEDCG